MVSLKLNLGRDDRGPTSYRDNFVVEGSVSSRGGAAPTRDSPTRRLGGGPSAAAASGAEQGDGGSHRARPVRGSRVVVGHSTVTILLSSSSSSFFSLFLLLPPLPSLSLSHDVRVLTSLFELARASHTMPGICLVYAKGAARRGCDGGGLALVREEEVFFVFLSPPSIKKIERGLIQKFQRQDEIRDVITRGDNNVSNVTPK